MDAREKLIQIRVGIFMVIGIVAVAAMVVYFGRFGDGLRKYYEIRVEYTNASGLLKGASVLLAGAKIGAVDSPPTILPDMNGVYVNLKIYDEVEIPDTSVFTIGSSGLLGDRFVEIVTGKDATSAPRIEPGATIQGKPEGGGLGAITESAGDVLAEVREAVKAINNVASKIDSQVLSESAVADLKKTIANLEKTSASFAEASQDIGGVVEQAKTTIASGDAMLVAAKSAAEEFKKAMSDVRNLLAQARKGSGPIGTLLNDKEMANNIKALVENLRKHGVLWYKDRAGQ